MEREKTVQVQWWWEEENTRIFRRWLIRSKAECSTHQHKWKSEFLLGKIREKCFGVFKEFGILGNDDKFLIKFR